MTTATQTLKEFILENYADNIPDIANHGCQGGVSGMIYYDETSALYDKFHECIWETINHLKDDLGENALDIMASSTTAKNVNDEKTFKNYMLWFAVEVICQDIQSEREEENEQEGGAE